MEDDMDKKRAETPQNSQEHEVDSPLKTTAVHFLDEAANVGGNLNKVAVGITGTVVAMVTGAIYCFGVGYASYYTIGTGVYNPLDSFNIYQIIPWLAVFAFVFLTNWASFLYVSHLISIGLEQRSIVFRFIPWGFIISGVFTVATAYMIALPSNPLDAIKVLVITTCFWIPPSITFKIWLKFESSKVASIVLTRLKSSTVVNVILASALLCSVSLLYSYAIFTIFQATGLINFSWVVAEMLAFLDILYWLLFVCVGPIIGQANGLFFTRAQSSDAREDDGASDRMEKPNQDGANHTETQQNTKSQARALVASGLAVFIGVVVVCVAEGYQYAATKQSYFVTATPFADEGVLEGYLVDGCDEPCSDGTTASLVILETQDRYCVQKVKISKGSGGTSVTAVPGAPSEQEWIPKEGTKTIYLTSCQYSREGA